MINEDNQRARLCGMMFGQYLLIGSYVVTLGTYLMASPLNGGLHFPPSYTGWIYSTFAIAGIVAPLFMGVLADRLFAAEKLMGALHLVGSLLLIAAGLWCGHRQPQILEAFLLESPALAERVDETFAVLFVLLLVYAFCHNTTLTLSNVVAFRNLRDPTHSFGRVRLFGTVGWIVAGVQLSLFWDVVSPQPLLLAGGISLLFGLYCFLLPYTPPGGGHRTAAEALGLPALSMFRSLSFCVLIISSLGIAAVQQFYSIYTNRFLRELDAPYPAAVQTIAQVAEVACIVAVPIMLSRFGVKATLVVGIVGWVLRNAIFATENLPAVLAVGLPLHGLSYTFFMIVASMYVDRQSPQNLRASAQGIFSFITFGMGTLLGNWVSGEVVQALTVGDVLDWRTIWIVPAAASLAILAAFMLLFRDPGPLRPLPGQAGS